MASLYDSYDNKRSWLIDTAETAKDKKALPNQLKQLRAEYLAAKAAAARKSAGTTAGQPGAINVNKLYQQGR